MKIDRNWYLIAIAVVLASILIPFMQAGSFAGNVVDSQVVYRDGLFGPYIERVTLDSGAVMHVTQHPWYHFSKYSVNLPSMNIYGIVGSGISNEIHITVYSDDDLVPIVFKQQNDLDFTNSINWFWDRGKEECSKSRLVMYKGYFEEDANLDPYTNKWDDLVWSHGPYAYLQKWTSTLHFNPFFYEPTPKIFFTVEETLYDTAVTGYDTDLAYVVATVLEHSDPTDPTDPVVVRGTGSINVMVYDNMIVRPATVNLYKNDVLFQTVYVDGDYTFDDLEFGMYRFEVVDADYDTYFYDAFPQQSGYDYDIGNVELSAELNMIGYIVYGDFSSTPGSFGDIPGDGLIPDGNNNTAARLIDDVIGAVRGDDDNTDDSSLSLADIIAMIAALLASMGLLTSVAIIGLPIFLVVMLFLLVAAFVKSGDKKKEYSPGNKKKGGRKR